jgi:hypothetical protein
VNVKPLLSRSINIRNKASVDQFELSHLLIGIVDDCYLSYGPADTRRTWGLHTQVWDV